jgi:hypothetical protein
MSGFVDARRARWLHLGFSALIFLLLIGDARNRWLAVGYVMAASFNFFSYWLIETVGILKHREAQKAEKGTGDAARMMS